MSQQARNFKYNQGFTLIEIMVVVIILGILASIVVPKVMDRPDQAREVSARANIAGIEQALNMYRSDNYQYPTTEQGLESLVKQPDIDPVPRKYQRGGYLPRLPKDPWDRDYLYLNPGVHGEIDIYTLGADGVEGGEGANADIGNWTTE